MRFLRRLILGLLVVILVIVLATGGLGLYTYRRMLPQTAGELSIPGLRDTVTVYRDSFGVPHIYASNTADLFLAQGYVHAQDRWWQMEFQRHVGLGRIGELTGSTPSVLRTDTFIRTVGWNRAAAADVAAASPETLAVVNAYSSGVNAYIADKPGGALAFEYSLLGVTGVSIPVEPWQPLHSAAWAKVLAWQLSSNMDAELNALGLLERLGPDAEERIATDIVPSYPADHPTIMQPEDVQASTAPAAARLPDSPRLDWSGVARELIGGIDLNELRRAFSAGASNSWVVSGQLTESGRPLLANDPHLGIQMPSLFYLIGLHCAPVGPDCPYNIVGFSLPGAPGVLIGYNDHIAWGLTTPETDVQDLYAIQVDPTDDTKYTVDGAVQTMQVITETIRFGDGTPPVDVRVRLTRYGPIITDSPTHVDSSKRPLALRWAALDQPYDLLGAALGVNKATNWDEFRAALAGWAIPSQNFIYADRDGNIGYQLPGRVPIRSAGHSGMMPVDGSTSRYDWRGFLPYEQMPRVYNPPRGYIITANNRIAPAEFNTALQGTLGAQFGADSLYFGNPTADYGFRAKRISDLLTATEKHSVASFRTMQADSRNNGAPHLLPAALSLDYGNEVPRPVLDWMAAWDYSASTESGQQALFESFWSRLAQNVWADERGETAVANTAALAATVRLLDQPDSAWWDDISTPDRRETRDDILRRSFVEGYNALVTRFGADFNAWRWGALHTATFISNPLGLSGIGPVESIVNSGPVGVHGSHTTLTRSTYDSTDEADPFGAANITSLRLIVDFGDLNNSIGIQTTGQSGHPASGHYRDLIERWRTGEYIPVRLTYTDEELNRMEKLTLRSR